MNVGIIIKIEGRLLPDGEFFDLEFTGFSGTISKNTLRTNAGTLHETTVEMKIPQIQPVITALLNGLLFRPAQYRISDGNGKTHLVGDNNFPAKLSYVHGIDGSPGSWNGYKVSIHHNSPHSYPVTEN